jgi:hypothetical protein
MRILDPDDPEVQNILTLADKLEAVCCEHEAEIHTTLNAGLMLVATALKQSYGEDIALIVAQAGWQSDNGT